MDAFSSADLTRAISIARQDALSEAARIAEQDHTPGYGARAPTNADIEWLALEQRRRIADRIRAAISNPTKQTRQDEA